MFLKKYATEVQEAREQGRQGTKQLVTDLGECTGKKAKANIPDLRNTTFMVVIRRVPNGNNNQTSSNQLQVLYTDVRLWEELIDFIEKNCFLKEPYCLTAILKCNLTQEELDEECMGLYTPRQMMNDPLYGQILYNSSLSNAIKLKQGQNVKLVLVEMKAATGKDIAKHVKGPAKVIPAHLVSDSYAHC